MAVVPLGFEHGLGGAFILAVLAQLEQNQHAARRYEQHRGFTEGIKGAVIQNHAGHEVDRAGFLNALFNVTLGNLIVVGIIRRAKGRQLNHGAHQEGHHAQKHHHGRRAVGHLESPGAAGHAPLVQAAELLRFLLHQGVAQIILLGLVGGEGLGAHLALPVIAGAGDGLHDLAVQRRILIVQPAVKIIFQTHDDPPPPA